MSSSSEPPSPTLGRTFLDRLTSVFHEEELNDRADVLEVRGEARRRNVIDDEVFSMMEGAMAVSEISAGDLLVPRSQVQAVDFSEPREVWLPALIASGHSRLPAVEDDLDNVLGILHAKDLLQVLMNPAVDPKTLLRPARFIPETQPINVLLRDFKETRSHLALVIDEFGSISGLITIEDVLEQIVGEIWDETDKDETPIRQLSENSWQVEGDVNVEDFFDAIGFVDKTFDCDYNSVGGWALAELEHIPSAGESFGYKQLHVTIRAVKDQRIESLLVTRGEHGGGDAPPE